MPDVLEMHDRWPNIVSSDVAGKAFDLQQLLPYLCGRLRTPDLESNVEVIVFFVGSFLEYELKLSAGYKPGGGWNIDRRGSN